MASYTEDSPNKLERKKQRQLCAIFSVGSGISEQKDFGEDMST